MPAFHPLFGYPRAVEKMTDADQDIIIQLHILIENSLFGPSMFGHI